MARRHPFKLYPIGSQLLRLRKEKGMSRSDLEQITGIARNHIGRIENGHVSASLEILERLAEGLGVKLWEIIRDVPHGQEPQPTSVKVMAFFLKLKPFLVQLPERDRQTFLRLAEALAKHPES
jgi:transcriptional regulator with XRE-family HTH domain